MFRYLVLKIYFLSNSRWMKIWSSEDSDCNEKQWCGRECTHTSLQSSLGTKHACLRQREVDLSLVAWQFLWDLLSTTFQYRLQMFSMNTNIWPSSLNHHQQNGGWQHPILSKLAKASRQNWSTPGSLGLAAAQYRKYKSYYGNTWTGRLDQTYQESIEWLISCHATSVRISYRSRFVGWWRAPSQCTRRSWWFQWETPECCSQWTSNAQSTPHWQ